MTTSSKTKGTTIDVKKMTQAVDQLLESLPRCQCGAVATYGVVRQNAMQLYCLVCAPDETLAKPLFKGDNGRLFQQALDELAVLRGREDSIRAQTAALTDLLPLDTMPIHVKHFCSANAFYTFGDIARLTPADLLNMPSCGTRTLRALRLLLRMYGLQLKPTTPRPWRPAQTTKELPFFDRAWHSGAALSAACWW